MKYSEQEIEQFMDEMKSLLDEFKGAKGRWEDEQDRKYWDEKYGDRLGQYADKLKLLNGDDFDIIDEARKEYHKDFSDLSDDDYANSLEENIKRVLKRIWPEADKEQIEQAAEEITEGEEPEVTTEISIESKPEEEKKEDDAITSDENAKGFRPIKIRGDKASGKENDWPGNPKDIRSDEECKEEADNSIEKDFVKELEDYKAHMPKRGE